MKSTWLLCTTTFSLFLLWCSSLWCFISCSFLPGGKNGFNKTCKMKTTRAQILLHNPQSGAFPLLPSFYIPIFVLTHILVLLSPAIRRKWASYRKPAKSRFNTANHSSVWTDVIYVSGEYSLFSNAQTPLQFYILANSMVYQMRLLERGYWRLYLEPVGYNSTTRGISFRTHPHNILPFYHILP